MGMYRKRPVVIEAMRWSGSNWHQALEFVVWRDGTAHTDGEALVITTMEGPMIASPGDWIIRGVAGEFYPCKPEIFEATYEPADEAVVDVDGDAA